MSTSDLKPCPFCGEPAEYDSQRWRPPTRENFESATGHAITCSRCEAEVGLFDCYEDAAAAWNQRATLEGLAAPGEMLRDRPELTALIAKSRAAYEAMSPEEREAHDKAQRDSWVRGNIELDRLERAEQATRRFIAPADAPDGAG